MREMATQHHLWLTFAGSLLALGGLQHCLTECRGPSMAPTLASFGDLVLWDPWLYRLIGAFGSGDRSHARFTRGQVVRAQVDGGKAVLKRIAALGGDRVFCRDRDFRPVIVDVPQDHVFLLGDNPMLSRDSRDYGPVHVDQMMGPAIAVISPWNRRRWLKDESDPPISRQANDR